jgi:hypothetical protein
MEQPVHNPGLIENKRAAIGVFCLTTLLILTDLRHGIATPKHGSYWLFDSRWFLLPRVALAVNLLFYVYLLWIGISFYRAAQGPERLIVVGWLVAIFLGPIQFLFSISPDVIGYITFVAMLSALLASAYILFKLSSAAPTQHSQE